MQDLIMALDKKESEIQAFMDEARKEREGLLSRLNEVDTQLTDADRDLRRINKARNALRNPDEAEMLREDVTAMQVAHPMPQGYFPER